MADRERVAKLFQPLNRRDALLVIILPAPPCNGWALSSLTRRGVDTQCPSMFLVNYLKAATRAACSRITRALSSSAVPASSPLTLTNGLDHTGRRGQPPQLSL